LPRLLCSKTAGVPQPPNHVGIPFPLDTFNIESDPIITSAGPFTNLLEESVQHVEDAKEDWVRDLKHACYVVCKRAVEFLRGTDLVDERSKLLAHHRLLFEFMEGHWQSPGPPVRRMSGLSGHPHAGRSGISLRW